MTQIHEHRLDNGLTLIAEEVSGAQSLAMTILLPAGVAHEAADRPGSAGILSEMLSRGAAGRSAREQSEALDILGVDRSTSAETRFLRLSATMIHNTVGDALPLLMDMVRRPNLAEASLEPTRALAMQALQSLQDEPQERVIYELRKRHHPAPLNRSPYGEVAGVEATSLQDVHDLAERGLVPGGAILAFAGRFDWQSLKSQVENLLGDWQGRDEPLRIGEPPSPSQMSMQADTNQVHIALAYDAVPERDERSVLQRLAAAVLSGGTASRLFNEVREKRGLCYAVQASYSSFEHRGVMTAYAGTTVARAQETLEVLVQELRRLGDGADQAEFDRAVVGLKSRLVMQGESTSARAVSLALDQHLVGRPRSLHARAGEIDNVTLDRLNAFLQEHRVGKMSIVTIGPKPLKEL